MTSLPDAMSSPPASLIIVLAALSLAATGGAIAIALIQRRRKGGRDGETGQRGRLMTPEDPTRAAVRPKSALDNWPMNAAAPPPREGRPWLESASE